MALIYNHIVEVNYVYTDRFYNQVLRGI